MTEKTKETVGAISKVAFPALGALGLLGLIIAGGGLTLASLVGVMVFYEPAFFGITFAIGFLVAVLGVVLLSQRLFQMK